MNKKSLTLKEKIKQVNHSLVNHFGIPFRPKKLPNPVDALIATILSQNTNDNNSYKAYLNLKRRYESIDKLAEAPKREIENTIKVAGYVTVDLRSAYHFNKNWMLSAKLNNLLDKNYQTVDTFNSAGRNFFVSIHYNN